MKIKKTNTQLDKWKAKYENAKIGYADTKSKLAERKKQYDGNLQPKKGRETETMYNFTKELIETEIDNGIPAPKVEPSIYTKRNIILASVIESMVRGEIKRLELTEFNDTNERNSKIYGGDVALIDWDNTVKTHYTVGAVGLRNITPIRFVPQPNIEKIDEMDYIFVDFDLTKKAIKKKYGVDVSDAELEDKTDITSDTVTQHYVFYKNSKGFIGCFSWVDDIVVIDEDNYNARQIKVCKKCGATKPADKSACICGSKDFEKRNLKYEELNENKTTNNLDENGEPIVIPAMSYAKQDGEYLYRGVETQATEFNPVTGALEPLYEQIFDENMNAIGERPQTIVEQQPYLEPTKIPYYTPQTFPVVIRKNIARSGEVLGDSDCEFIKELQLSSNKLATRMNDKVSKEGSILYTPKDLNYSPSNTEQFIEVDSPEQVNMIGTKNLQFDTSQNINLINQNYMWAKSSLGINDSFQGKADATAESGRAKESQVSRALGRQESKAKMKNVFYATIYRKIFEYMLAYADEPRKYTAENQSGDTEEIIFDRYDFLEQDEFGNWFYNDQFTFSIDASGTTSDNRQYVLENMQNDFMGGLYGDVNDPETLYNFWKDRAEQGYPNAKRQVARWKIKVDEKKQMEEMQQQALLRQTVPQETQKDQATVTQQMKNSVTGKAFGKLGG